MIKASVMAKVHKNGDANAIKDQPEELKKLEEQAKELVAARDAHEKAK